MPLPGALRPQLWRDGAAWDDDGRSLGPETPITCLAWHGPGGSWVTGHGHGSVSTWYQGSLALRQPPKFSGHAAAIIELACATFAPVLVIRDSKGPLGKWRFLRGSGRLTLQGLHVGPVERVAVSASGNVVAALSHNGGETWLSIFLKPEPDRELPVAWTVSLGPGTEAGGGVLRFVAGDRRVMVGRRNRLLVFDVCAKRELPPLAVLRGAISEVISTADDARILVAGADGAVRILRDPPPWQPPESADGLRREARASVKRGLTPAQRIAHYVDALGDARSAEERIPPPPAIYGQARRNELEIGSIDS